MSSLFRNELSSRHRASFESAQTLKRHNAIDTSYNESHSIDCNDYMKFTGERKDEKKTEKRWLQRRCNYVNNILTSLIRKSKFNKFLLTFLGLFLVWAVFLNHRPEIEPEIEPDLVPYIYKSRLEPKDIENLKFENQIKNAPKCDRITDSSSIDFTLVSQLSDDRLWMLPYHCQRWGFHNKMSIVILSDLSIEEIHERIQPKCNPASIHIQLVSTDNASPDSYPVNAYRNMALSVVNTTHVVYVDIDFWESENLYSVLNTFSIKEKLISDNKLLLVIPALQIQRMCQEYRDCPEDNIPKMPRNMENIHELHRRSKKLVTPFDPTNYGGHSSTQYDKWFSKQKEGELLDIPCITSNRYEPYTVFKYCQDLPPFQEQFTGFGKNKISWTMHLRRLGYKFMQIGGVFVVHYPHLDSKSRLSWNKIKTNKREKMDELFVNFRSWLRKTYVDKSRTKLCDDSINDDTTLWIPKNRLLEKKTVEVNIRSPFPRLK